MNEFPNIRVELASAPASTAKDPVPLTDQDIHALPGVGGSVAALIKFFQSFGFITGAFLDVGAVLISLFWTTDNIEDPAVAAATKSDALVDQMAAAADSLRLNAQAPEPQPAKEVVRVKAYFKLFCALAAANAQSPLRAELHQTNGSRRPLPIPDITEMSGVRRRAEDAMEVNSRIMGLVRGDDESRNEFIIEGDVHIRLSGKSPHLWAELHSLWFLDSPHRLVGTVVRTSNTQKWTITDDTRVETQTITDESRTAAQYEMYPAEKPY